MSYSHCHNFTLDIVFRQIKNQNIPKNDFNFEKNSNYAENQNPYRQNITILYL